MPVKYIIYNLAFELHYYAAIIYLLQRLTVRCRQAKRVWPVTVKPVDIVGPFSAPTERANKKYPLKSLADNSSMV